MPWKECSLEAQRMEFVRSIESGKQSVAHASAAIGISRRTGYKWLARFRSGGLPALSDRSRRPARTPTALTGEMVLRVVELRQLHPTWGPKKLRSLLDRELATAALPSVSSIGRVLQRAKLSEAKGRGRRRCLRATPRVAAKADVSNALWSVDFKGWWISRDRKKVVPLTVQDTWSRMVFLARPLERLDTDEVRQCFEELFRRYGLPGAIRCDNGAPFASLHGPQGLTRLSAWWRQLGIKLDRIDPGHPEQNGVHERMHREISAAAAWSRLTWVDASARLESWRGEYNVERPHEALGMRRPAELYRRCRVRWDGVIPAWEYPSSWQTRLLKRGGEFRLSGAPVFVSESLGCQRVGLEPAEEMVGGRAVPCLRLWFCDLDLGVLRQRSGRWRLTSGVVGGGDKTLCSGPQRRPTASSEARKRG